MFTSQEAKTDREAAFRSRTHHATVDEPSSVPRGKLVVRWPHGSFTCPLQGRQAAFTCQCLFSDGLIESMRSQVPVWPDRPKLQVLLDRLAPAGVVLSDMMGPHETAANTPDFDRSCASNHTLDVVMSDSPPPPTPCSAVTTIWIAGPNPSLGSTQTWAQSWCVPRPAQTLFVCVCITAPSSPPPPPPLPKGPRM